MKETLESRIRDLEDAIKWGVEHPYAGYCGEDDARADELARLRQELSERRSGG